MFLRNLLLMGDGGYAFNVWREMRWKRITFLMCACMLSRFSHVQFFATLWTIAYQAPLSVGFSRQEYWSGLPCPPPGDHPDPRIQSHLFCLLHWQAGSLPLGSPRNPSSMDLSQNILLFVWLILGLYFGLAFCFLPQGPFVVQALSLLQSKKKKCETFFGKTKTKHGILIITHKEKLQSLKSLCHFYNRILGVWLLSCLPSKVFGFVISDSVYETLFFLLTPFSLTAYTDPPFLKMLLFQLTPNFPQAAQLACMPIRDLEGDFCSSSILEAFLLHFLGNVMSLGWCAV